MPILISIGIAKTNKYASRESGDTVEIVERPGGGMSVIMADGQGSGRAAKSLSMLVTAKVAALLKEGVRDGASARAANDFLFAMRHGQVSATLDILSVDLKSGTVVVTRNSATDCLVSSGDGAAVIPGNDHPLGLHARTRPWATEFPTECGTQVILVSDGIAHSGSRRGLPRFDLGECARQTGATVDAQTIADYILAAAIERDAGKPADDMSVVVLTLSEHHQALPLRRMSAEVPIP
ncbi:MAG: PP2C family protein-serine/threonine phosphatase [Thermomicrobiales bacterium]